jgi:acylphosphatase
VDAQSGPEKDLEKEVISKRVIVYGRVQGVFFRDSLRRVAAGLGVRGWVRNREDGSVEAVLEGRPAAVAEAIEFMKVGPPRARVDSIRIWDETPSGYDRFDIVG